MLDTNVLVSALVFPGGAPETVYWLVLSGTVLLITSQVLLAELRRVLSMKFGWDAGRVDAAIAQIGSLATIVEPGDRHLLRLGAWRGIQILTPAAFLEQRERGPGGREL